MEMSFWSIEISEGSLEITSYFKIRKSQKREMAKCNDHIQRAFSKSNQEFKILHQYSNLVIMVSKITLCQFEITFCDQVYVLCDN